MEAVEYPDVPEVRDGVEAPEPEGDSTELWTPAIRMSDFGLRPVNPVQAYVDKFAYAGAVTLLAGAPKAGKSTLLFHMMNAAAGGEDFLDQPTAQANVLYATEQSEASFRAQAMRVPGLFENPKAFVVLVERNCTWRPKLGADHLPLTDHITGSPIWEMEFLDKWEKQIEFWRKMIVATHAKILVIDTFTAFARLKENSNNDPGVISTRLMELKSLFQTRPDLSIIILHHLRKPENNAKSGRTQDENDVLGSQSYIAGVDQIVVLSEKETGTINPMRRLRFKGRFEVESTLEVALIKDKYVRTGY